MNEKNFVKFCKKQVVNYTNEHLDKTDNRIENLHLFKSQNEHQKAHVELSVVAAEFIKRGIIKFENGHYRINIWYSTVYDVRQRLDGRGD